MNEHTTYVETNFIGCILIHPLQETGALGRVFETAAIKNAAQVEAKAPFSKTWPNMGLKPRFVRGAIARLWGRVFLR